MAKKKTFKVGEDVFDIPAEQVEQFKSEMPDAVEVESFVIGKDTFDIPVEEVGRFKSEMPKAKPLFAEEAEKKNDELGTKKPEAGGGSGVLSQAKDFLGGIAESVTGFFEDEEEPQTTTAPRPKPDGKAVLEAMPREQRLDFYADATKKIAEQNPTWEDNDWAGYYQRLAKSSNLSNEDVIYIEQKLTGKKKTAGTVLNELKAFKGKVPDNVQKAIVGSQERAANNTQFDIMSKALQNPAYSSSIDENDVVSLDNYLEQRKGRVDAINQNFDSTWQKAFTEYEPIYQKEVKANPAYNAIMSQITQESMQTMEPMRQKAQQAIQQGADPNAVQQQFDAEFARVQKQVGAKYVPQIDEALSAANLNRYNTVRKQVEKQLNVQISPGGQVDIAGATAPKFTVLAPAAQKYWDGVFKSDNFKKLSQEDKKQYVAKSWNYVENKLVAKKFKPEQIAKAKDEFMYFALDRINVDEKTGFTSFAIREFADNLIPQYEERIAALDKEIKKYASTETGEYATGYVADKGVNKLLEEQAMLNQGLQALRNVQTMPEEDMGSFAQGLGTNKWKAIPFVSGAMELVDNVRIYNVANKADQMAKKMAAGQPIAPDEQLTGDEELFLKAIGLDSKLQQTVKPSMAYRTGDAIKQSLPFIGEFVATGGIFNTVKTGTAKTITQGLLSAGVKNADNLIYQNAVVKPLSYLVGAAAQTSANPQRYITRTVERMSPEVKFALSDEGTELISVIDGNTKYDDFQYRIGKNEPVGEALPRAFAETFVDNFTERFGVAVGVYGAPAKQFISKFIPDKGVDIMKRLSLATYLKKKGLAPTDATRHFVKRSLGWDGFGSEFFAEELPAMPLTNLLTGDAPISEGLLKTDDEGTHIDWDNLGVTAMSVGAMTVAIPTATVAYTAANRWADQGEVVNYLDQNGLATNVRVSRDNYTQLAGLRDKGYWEVEAWRRDVLPGLKAEGNERNFLDLYAKSLQREKAGMASPRIAERLTERLGENTAIAALNRIEQQKLEQAAMSDPAIRDLLNNAETASDKYISIVDGEQKDLYTEKWRITYMIKAAEMAADRKGQKGAAARAELEDLRRQLDNVNAQINDIQMSVTAAANMMANAPQQWSEMTSDGTLVVLDQDGNPLDNDEQQDILEVVLPKLSQQMGRPEVESARRKLKRKYGEKEAKALEPAQKPMEVVSQRPFGSEVSLGQSENQLVVNREGKVGVIKRSAEGEWLFQPEKGTAQVLPVSDKTDPTETLAQVGLEIAGTEAETGRQLKRQLVWDRGMRSIDRKLNRVNERYGEVLDKLDAGTALTEEEKADAVKFAQQVKESIANTKTGFEEDKQDYIDMLDRYIADIGASPTTTKKLPRYQVEVAPKRPPGEEEGPAAVTPTPKPTPPPAPAAPEVPAAPRTEMVFPEPPSRTKAQIKRLAGTKEGEAERIVNAIKQAYQEGKSPEAELAAMGYNKQEYQKTIAEVVEALKPTMQEVVEKPAPEVTIEPETIEVPAPQVTSRSKIEGKNLSEFKKGDIVFRDYNGRYEEYEIIDTKGSVWKVRKTDTGAERELNAANNGGFVLKTEAPAELPAPTLSLPELEDAKTLIDQRYFGRLANMMQKFQANDNNRDLTEDEIEEVEAYIESAKQRGWNVDRLFRKLNSLGYVYAFSNSSEAFKNYLEDRLSGKTNIKVTSEYNFNKEINAELSALEQPEPAAEIAPEVKSEDIQYIDGPAPQPATTNARADVKQFNATKESVLKRIKNSTDPQTIFSEINRLHEALKKSKSFVLTPEEQTFIDEKLKELKDKGYTYKIKKGEVLREGENVRVDDNQTLLKASDVTEVEKPLIEKELNRRKSLKQQLIKNGYSEEEATIEAGLSPENDINLVSQDIEVAVIKNGVQEKSGKVAIKFISVKDAELSALEQPEPAAEIAPEVKSEDIQYIDGNPVSGTAEVGQYRPEFVEDEILQVGKETQVIMPDGTTYKAVYVLANLRWRDYGLGGFGVLPSHDPNMGFRKMDGYPVDSKGNTTNDRDYQKDNAAQADVMRIASNPNYDLFVDLGQSVNTGPPVITKDGFVVAGNGRAMAISLLWHLRRYMPEQNDDLIKAIKNAEEDFGFTDVPTKGPQRFAVFRMLTDYDQQYSKAASAKFNQSEGKTKSEADTSLTFGASLSENARAKELLFDRIGQFDTMGEFFADKGSAKFSRDLMISSELVLEKDINKFFDENGRWTETGKGIFKSGVFATLFSEDIVRLTNTPGVASFIDKISKSLPAIAANFNLPADKNLKQELEGAIKFQNEYYSSGIPDVTDFIRQGSLFDKPSLESALLWALIDTSTAKNNLFRKALDSYNNSVTSNMGTSLFESEVIRSKQEFFDIITKNIPENEKAAIKSSLASEGFDIEGEGNVSEAYESYNRKTKRDGLLGLAANEPVVNEAQIGASQGGEIDRASLINFVKTMGVREDGTISRKLGEHYGDIAYELSRIPGNIQLFRDMAKGKKSVKRNVFRFKIDGVPFNPIEYLKTGRITGESAEGANELNQINEAQRIGDTGFSNKEIIYRQGQFNFDDHPDTRTVEVKGETPIKFRSVAEILDESYELTGNELTKALAESKLKRKLAEGEYILKTSKISISKDWDVFKKKGSIKSPADVAYMFRQLEDFNKEQGMLVMEDADGKIFVAHVSSGGIGGTMFDAQVVMDYALTFNAKKIWWVHNHPAGTMETSEADIRQNGKFREAALAVGMEFQGGVIVDWDKGAYSFIDPYGQLVDNARSYYDLSDAAVPTEEIPVYQNFIDSRNQNIPTQIYNKPQLVVNEVASLLTRTKAGEAPKGGVLLLNRALRMIGHLFLTGKDDIATIVKGVAASGADVIITYGTFAEPVVRVGERFADARVLDHVHVQSNTFGNYDFYSVDSTQFVKPDAANDIPNVEELSMPYGDNASRLEKAVQRAMLDGFVTFDEVILSLYTDYYNGDAAKIRQNLQNIKDAYDEVSLLEEFIETPISSIEEVARFDLDRFLISVNRPQQKEVSLRQQYNDFASWFEYNYPQYKFYYTIDLDSETGQAFFRIGKDPVKTSNGDILYYGAWLGNRKWQKEWNEAQKSEVFDRPPMIWVDKEITPVPFEHVKPNQYAIGDDQAVAVNLILDRFVPKTPGKEPKHGFMLGDGMGIGKTRIELVSANELIKAKGLPVLIITKGDNVVEQFQREAAALSLSNVGYKKDPDDPNKPMITVGTYEDLKGGKVGNGTQYAAVIFDEAHMLKNTGTQRGLTAEEFLQKADHVVFATGTPMDKPVQLAYFIQHMTGKDMDESLKTVGLFIEKGVLKRLPDSPKKDIKELFLMWRNNMIKEGAYIRREYPFYGTADKVYIYFNANEVEMLDRIKKGNGRNGIMAANRYQEHLKIPYVFAETIKALEEGKQVVVFCTGVNETTIYPDGKKPKDKMTPAVSFDVPQFANEFSRRLTAAGVKHAKIYGPDAAGKLEESRKFQRGDVKVAIATISSGGTGIDLDDQFGDAPREVIFATLPWSGNEFDQAQFRVSRRNTKSPSRMRFVFAENSWADAHKEGLVDKKMQTLRLIQAGQDPDIVDMQYWRTDADGGLIDIVEDEFNDQGENVSAPVANQYVEAVPQETPEVPTETPAEVKAKFESGDPETLRAVGALPALPAAETEYVKVTPENQQDPENLGEISPTQPSTKGQRTTIGGAKKQPSIPQRRSYWKSLLFGPAKPKSLSTMVLEIYRDLGIPTTGEFHMDPKYLGFYNSVRKDVSLKVAADIFVALHEAIHWADLSKLGGVSTRILKGNDLYDVRLARQLSHIHDVFYPGANKNAPMITKIKEGLTMYMQMKLYDPSLVSNYPAVTSEVFTPGGRYYGEVWDDVYNAFEKLKNDVASMSPIMQAGLRIADMNTPKSSDYTINTWNRYSKMLFKSYDESTPLALYDNAAGVGFGTAMERTDDQGRLQQSSQNAYFFYSSRNKLAANWVTGDQSFLSALIPSKPMFYDTNGQWSEGSYRMSDIIDGLKVIEKSNPDILSDQVWQNITVRPDETPDIAFYYSNYLMMRRVFMDYRKRSDWETRMQTIIATGNKMFQDLQTITDPDIHAAMYADFKRTYISPLRVAFEEWKKVNEIIGNEGGSYVELNPDFSASELAWVSPKFRDLHKNVYDPNLGNNVTDANSTQVYQHFNKTFAEVDKMFDSINRDMLRMMVATGMLKVQNANKYIQDNRRYPGYASFQRHISNTFFNDPETTNILGMDNVSKVRSTLQRRGSTRNIVDPLLSQAIMIHEVFRKGLKNLMWLRLANMSRTDEQLSRGLIALPTFYKAVEGKNGEVMYREPVIKGKIDIPGQVLIYANGVGKYYQIADESLLAFYNVMTEKGNTAMYSALFKAMVAPARLYTQWTTGIYPYWAVQNFVVDQISTFMNSRLGTIPLYTSAKNFLPAFGQAIGNLLTKQVNAFDLFQKMFPGNKPSPAQLQYLVEFMSMAGSNQTLMSQLMTDENKATVLDLFDVKPKGIIPTIKYGVTKKLPKVYTWTVDLASLPTNISEIIPRFSEYMQARERGMSIEAAMRYSIETMPFSKRGAGKIQRYYMPLVSYMHANFTVAFKTLQEAIAQPKKFATVWASVTATSALAIINLWEELDDDEKNYYLQVDATEMAQYFIIPARFMGGPDNTMYRFRIAEIVGSAYSMGMLYGISIVTTKPIEYKQMARAAASNLPVAVNPVEWAGGDEKIWSSVARQAVRFMPQFIKPVLGLYAEKTPTTSGVRPITPRSLEFYPDEFQYRIGSRGTSSVVKDITDNVTRHIGLSPIQTEYLIGQYLGRTGTYILDFIDEKENKSTFVKKREDYALRGRWYENFYTNLERSRELFTVIDTDRSPRPAKSNKELYQQWKNEVFEFGKEYTIHEQMGKLLTAAYKAREYGVVKDTPLPIDVYDKFDTVIKSFYDQESFDERKDKMDEAYKSLRKASKEIGYKDVEFFSLPKYSITLMPKELERTYNKLSKP